MEDTSNKTYDQGYQFGWDLAAEMEVKKTSDLLTEDDVLAIGTMFMDFYERIVANTATPYENGFVVGVSEFAKSLDTVGSSALVN